jgi:hypothetical protein
MHELQQIGIGTFSTIFGTGTGSFLANTGTGTGLPITV